MYRKNIMPKKKKKKKTVMRRCIDWYCSIPSRLREIGIGSVFVLLGVFLSLVMLNVAGTVGTVVREYLFMADTADGTPLLGFGLILLTGFCFVLGGYLITSIRPISYMRLLLGSAVGFFSVVMFLATDSTTAGGAVGGGLFKFLHDTVGFFTYILIPAGIIGSLFILGIFSHTALLEWLGHTAEKEEEIDDGEDDEEEEPDEEEEYDDAEEEEEYEEEEIDDGEEEEDEEPEYEDEEEEEEYDEEETSTPHQHFAEYVAPPISLLSAEKGKGRAENTKIQAQAIARTLKNFNIEVTVEEVTVGPTFTRYAVRPAEGIRLSKITNLQQNLELALAAHPVRIEAPIPGQSLVGIEVPNSTRAVVGLRTLLESEEFQKTKGSLAVAIGKTINGTVFSRGLAKMPHALVAGTTGSGKSVLVHNLILSLLFFYGPRNLRFIFIDPKRVELTLYKGLPHLYTEPITDPKKALQALVWTVNEMERRYEILEDIGVRDIISYNRQVKEGDEILPYIVVVVDELADLMQNFPREIEGNIVRITQKSRAVGIHLVISTQRPSVNIITGVVKANVPVRIALQVASGIDSRTILDATGAENLIGGGDLLFASAETKKPIRVQSAFIDEEEVKAVVSHVIKHNGVADGLIDVTQKQSSGAVGGGGGDDDDDLYADAREIVIQSGKASTSLLQRKLKIGYSRAARLIDLLEEHGVVGPQVGSKPREILVESDGFDAAVDDGEDDGREGS